MMQDVAETAQTMRICSPAATIQRLLVLVSRGTCVFWPGFPSPDSLFAFPCFLEAQQICCCLVLPQHADMPHCCRLLQSLQKLPPP